jgi:endonuclease III related protein
MLTLRTGRTRVLPHSRDGERLRAIYRALEQQYSYDEWHWSPALLRSPIEMAVSAVLVQHTTWTNAERAIEQLRSAGALDAVVLGAMPEAQLADLTRISGTPTVKARRLRALARTIAGAGGISALLALPAADMRERLLATHGIGPETADAICLYAAGQRTFVVDAYTQRLFRRIGVGPRSDRYVDWQSWLHTELATEDAEYFRRFHAYIVLHGKRICRPAPRCAICPLVNNCAEGQRRVGSAS